MCKKNLTMRSHSGIPNWMGWSRAFGLRPSEPRLTDWLQTSPRPECTRSDPKGSNLWRTSWSEEIMNAYEMCCCCADNDDDWGQTDWVPGWAGIGLWNLARGRAISSWTRLMRNWALMRKNTIEWSDPERREVMMKGRDRDRWSKEGGKGASGNRKGGNGIREEITTRNGTCTPALLLSTPEERQQRGSLPWPPPTITHSTCPSSSHA